jgi:putative flippase GtrA
MRLPLGRESLPADAIRFLVAGAINTALTIAIYQLALSFLPFALAYVVAWLAGIAFLVIVYPDWVFPSGRRAPRDRLLLAASYVLVFFMGLGVLEIATRLIGGPRLAIVVAMAATTVANFVLSRTILRR